LSTIKVFDIIVSMAGNTRNDQLWAMLVELMLSGRARGWWIDLCAELDLTPAQGHALRSLDPERPVPMSSLAEALWCDASNVTGIVDKLETRGLIARQGADHDRRIKQLIVTERGRRLRDKLLARVQQPPKAVAGLPADVKAHIVDAIRSLMAADRIA
jgi:MarR family transcriptional regulator, organic hydroperoxide resistance regulator